MFYRLSVFNLSYICRILSNNKKIGCKQLMCILSPQVCTAAALPHWQQSDGARYTSRTMAPSSLLRSTQTRSTGCCSWTAHGRDSSRRMCKLQKSLFYRQSSAIRAVGQGEISLPGHVQVYVTLLVLVLLTEFVYIHPYSGVMTWYRGKNHFHISCFLSFSVEEFPTYTHSSLEMNGEDLPSYPVPRNSIVWCFYLEYFFITPHRESTFNNFVVTNYLVVAFITL